jgi:transmembrane sensor
MPARADVVVRPSRSRRWGAPLAGALAVPLLLLALMYGPHAAQDWRSDMHTAVGAPAARQLPDGSTLQLDTDSAVQLDFRDGRRDVRLLRGALDVAVAKDPAHPFRVLAGDLTATAVGTHFVVSRTAQDEVAVSEGRVRVEVGGAMQLVDAGQRAVRVPEGLQVTALPAFEQAWTNGSLSFNEQPLVDATAAIARYLPQRVLLRVPDAAARRVTAVLPLRDPAAALESLATTQGLSLRRYPGLIVVAPRE